MSAADDAVRRLRAAIEEIGAAEGAALVEQAHEQASSRVRSMLTEALAEAMLEGARRRLERDDVAAAPPQPAPAVVGQEPTAVGELGWYVYCVMSADGSGPEPNLPGVDPSHAVQAVRSGELVAVVSQVPLAEFEEEALRERLSDLDWVERTARAHERVVEAAQSGQTVIPLRLCSVYRRREGVLAMLEERREPLVRALAGLEGSTEWGVRVFAVGPPRAAEPAPAPAAGGARTGTAYLERREREQRDRHAGSETHRQAVEAIHARLAAVSDDQRVLAPQRPQEGGHPGEMIHNGAYLVRDAGREAFEAEIAALAEEHSPQGLALERTGPWPAYNFVPASVGAPA